MILCDWPNRGWILCGPGWTDLFGLLLVNDGCESKKRIGENVLLKLWVIYGKESGQGLDDIIQNYQFTRLLRPIIFQHDSTTYKTEFPYD